MAVKTYLADIWSATDFHSEELDGYAATLMCADIRRGVRVMAMLSLAMQICMAILAVTSNAGFSYLYTSLLLGVLSLHVIVSVNYVSDVSALQMLGMVLLIVTALAISFLAHRIGDLHAGMVAGVIMLFIAIPLVPWALREATMVIVLTYGLLMASLTSVPGRFDSEALLALQFLGAGAAVIVTVIIARNTSIRKQDIRAQYELEQARKKMEMLSMKDHLTGAWNRRYLELRFPEVAKACRRDGKTLHVAVLDIDDFKGINDQFGHHVGDDVLRGIGSVFVELLGNDGWLIRLGGDEFQVFYCADGLPKLIGKAVEKLHGLPVMHDLEGLRTVTLSAGFTSTGFDRPIDLDSLYKCADEGLYASKYQRTKKLAVSNLSGKWQL